MVTSAPVIALREGAPATLVRAIQQGGGVLGPIERADALVHTGKPASLPVLPDSVRWVQLPAAGIEAYVAAGVIDHRRLWTSAAGAYAATVAEHAIALLVAGVRGLVSAARQPGWRRDGVASRVGTLADATVAVVGAGGVGRRVVGLLAPFGARAIAVNHSGRDVPGAARTLAAADADEFWDEVDHVVLAAPATPQTRHLVNTAVLSRLKPTSWIVNVGRGALVDTDALVAAIRAGRVGGAALDVIDPEPLPDDHPLWTMPQVLITPHTANPPKQKETAYAERIRDNVARFASGRDLLGVIDPDTGY
jgi:phosphoglycerate dehydrogenase-like enzyme